AIIGALLPAYQASNIPAIQSTRRSEQETSFIRFLPKLRFIGLMGLIASSLILYYSKTNLVLNFIALALIIISVTTFIPSFLRLLVSLINYVSASWLDTLSKISIRSISRNLSRSSIAIIALMIALSISLSLDITVNSFRATVKDWLDSSLKADVYISAPSLSANQTTGSLSEELMDKLKDDEIISSKSQALISYRNNSVQSNLGEIRLASIDLKPQVIESFKFKKIDPNWLENFSNTNALIVSEPFAYKNNLKIGSKISLKTKYGNKEFRILGIFFDYGSDQGIAMIYKKNYQKLWDDYNISSLGIIIKDQLEKDLAINAIKESLAIINLKHNFNYRSNYDLKKESLEIFDRTFQITKALKFISIFIAFIAIISTLLALNLERQKEYAILGALGLSQKQISTMIMKQSFFMGIISAIIAVPVGLIEAVLLLQVINLRSFGWTLNFHFDPITIAEVFIVAILAAFIASLYPAFKNQKGYLSLRND
ncbi:MAG: ABC transporter permease, partial [Proteobacteria bacterium]|nr:ABC transporter permease [Pseudomonadota bacterium]